MNSFKKSCLAYIIIAPFVLAIAFFLNALFQYVILYLYGATDHFSWATACGVYAFMATFSFIKALIKALVKK